MFLPSLTLLVAGCLGGADARPLDGGLHQRLLTANGPVHVWCPRDVEPELVVVYVHGYFDSVDEAFEKHGLVSQFQQSGVPALFVLVEAPTGPREQVRWKTYASLEVTLSAALERAVPTRVLALGHSGGNRTLREWTREGRVTDYVLLDAFYGDATPWTRLLETVPGAQVQLVGALTHQKAETWRRSLPATYRAQVEQFVAATNHMGVVTDGRWIPRLLRQRLTRS